MDQYQLIATVAWAGFALALTASASAPFAARDAGRSWALALLAVATLYTLGFSFLTGFSIGRGVVLLPLLFAGYAVALGRGRRWRITCLLAALGVYVVFSWLLIPVYYVIAGTPLAFLDFVFGFAAVPLYAALALVAFVWAALNPPRSIPAA